MTAVYAVSLVVGVVLLLAWVAAVAVAETVDGWDHVDPENRFGFRGRLGVAAPTGFGLGGMSATFAGWPAALAVTAAVAGAILIVSAARYLGPSEDSEGT